MPKHDIRADLGPSRTVTQSEEKILGMSPKKAHEIVRMSAYLSTLLSTSPELVEVIHAVDVGAGQVSICLLHCECVVTVSPVFLITGHCKRTEVPVSLLL